MSAGRVRRFEDNQYGQLGVLPFTRQLVPTTGATRSVRAWHTADPCVSQDEPPTVPPSMERLDRVMPDTSDTDDAPEKPLYTRSEVDQAISVALRRIVKVMAEQQEHTAIDAVYRACAEVGVSTDDPDDPLPPPEPKRPVNWPMTH